MGFDFYLKISVQVDPATGLPFVWGKNSTKLPYDPEGWRLPEEFREFAQMRGHFLHLYTDTLEQKYRCYELDPGTFLSHYPTWSEIADRIDFEYDDWNEEKHNRFKRCLKWCDNKGGYVPEWSY